jgi:hypothetical protein
MGKPRYCNSVVTCDHGLLWSRSEHLVRTCLTCGYVLVTACEDAVKKEKKHGND